jgi:hypothetical protein
VKRPSLCACRNWGHIERCFDIELVSSTGALNQRHFNRVFEYPMQNPSLAIRGALSA